MVKCVVLVVCLTQLAVDAYREAYRQGLARLRERLLASPSPLSLSDLDSSCGDSVQSIHDSELDFIL
jgi:hypothetical protein